jgi:glycosyltransferase involved in cell wall biosynthesis
MMKILYLYSELVGYQISVFKEYVSAYGAEVHVISWDKKKLKPYSPPAIDGVSFYKRSWFDKESLLHLTSEIKPDIIYVSGWMDKTYLYVTKQMKKAGIPVVTGFDDMWVNSFRQKIGAFIFPLYYKKYFSYAWVAGAYQYEFAKRLGFKNNEIIFDLLSADTTIFKADDNLEIVKKPMQKAFLYVGNFRHVKGFDILIEAFDIYKNKFGGKWKLICVGNGELQSLAVDKDDIDLYPFTKSADLVDIAKSACVFILPSRKDQWGVVVHEFACLGMPMLLSEFVGARSYLFINGYNGLMFFHNSPSDLAEKMFQLSCLNAEELNEMGQNSILLSKRISIKSSVASFMSLTKK